ncbi:hypothetical protein ACTSKR_08435 [Chitinibacteraceae bacterium HSL-7]
MIIQKLLPSSAFIPFKAKKLRLATVLHVDLSILHEHQYLLQHQSDNDSLCQDLLELFGYVVPTPEDEAGYFYDEEKEFLAERYGGVGILSNGGGARCGLVGPFQIKGIGLTPVSGRSVNYWYRTGAIPLYEALADGIYSQAADVALPFRGSRVVAIIDTGMPCWCRAYRNTDPEKDERIQVRRGLLVRESGIRPAHFSRAFYFKPHPEIREKIPHDFDRVRDCVAVMPSVMRTNNNAGGAEPIAQEYRLAIDQMMSKAALQLAVSKAKRLMHGSLTQSNYLVNGGWIDYGTCSTVPTYGEAVTTANQPSYWQEHTLFQKTSEDLCFYTKKYVEDPEGVLDGVAVFDRFSTVYYRQLICSMLQLTGFPSWVLKSIPHDSPIFELGQILLWLAMQERPVPFLEDFSERPTSGYAMSVVLNDLLREKVAEGLRGAQKMPLLEALNEKIRMLYSLLWAFGEAKAAERGVTQSALLIFVALDMTRRLGIFRELHRDILLQECAALADCDLDFSARGYKIASYFERNRYLSEVLLGESSVGDVPLAKGALARLGWAPNTSAFVFEVTNEYLRIAELIEGKVEIALVNNRGQYKQLEKRSDGSWALAIRCECLADFVDLCNSTLRCGNGEVAAYTMEDLFYGWVDLSQMYSRALKIVFQMKTTAGSEFSEIDIGGEK